MDLKFLNTCKKQTKDLYYFIFYYSSFIFPFTCTIELRVDAVIHRQLMRMN